jgi:hypothetical protein
MKKMELVQKVFNLPRYFHKFISEFKFVNYATPNKKNIVTELK